MLRTALIATLVLGGTMPAWADQCAMNAKQVSTNALTLISFLPAVQVYCLPCGDTTARRLPVSNPVVQATDDPNLFEVQVSGETIDLAYVFVPKSTNSTTWINLGLVVRCAPVQKLDVLQLPPNLVAN